MCGEWVREKREDQGPPSVSMTVWIIILLSTSCWWFLASAHITCCSCSLATHKHQMEAQIKSLRKKFTCTWWLPTEVCGCHIIQADLGCVADCTWVVERCKYSQAWLALSTDTVNMLSTPITLLGTDTANEHPIYPDNTYLLTSTLEDTTQRRWSAHACVLIPVLQPPSTLPSAQRCFSRK